MKHRVPILVVEDDLEVGEYIRSYLSREGFQVYLCQDGEQGLNYWRHYKPSLIISDLAMPRMNGEKLYRALRMRDKTTPFLFVSGAAKLFVDFVDDEWLRENSEFVKKPFSLTDLKRRVEGILASHREEVL